MRVALISITGHVGSSLSAELLMRGHRVTGIARSLEKAAAQSGPVLELGDATNSSTLAPLLVNHDAVISASWTFWLYGLLALSSWFFSYFLVPGTKGHPLEEISNFWHKKS